MPHCIVPKPPLKGILEEVRKAFGFSALELESSEEVLHDRPPQPEEEGGLEAARVRLRSSETFRRLDDGANTMACIMPYGSHLLFVLNEASSRLLYSNDEAYRLINTYKLLPILIFGGYVGGPGFGRGLVRSRPDCGRLASCCEGLSLMLLKIPLQWLA